MKNHVIDSGSTTKKGMALASAGMKYTGKVKRLIIFLSLISKNNKLYLVIAPNDDNFVVICFANYLYHSFYVHVSDV